MHASTLPIHFIQLLLSFERASDWLVKRFPICTGLTEFKSWRIRIIIFLFFGSSFRNFHKQFFLHLDVFGAAGQIFRLFSGDLFFLILLFDFFHDYFIVEMLFWSEVVS